MADEAMKKCPLCEGKKFTDLHAKCPTCHGAKEVTTTERCPDCRGDGVYVESENEVIECELCGSMGDLSVTKTCTTCAGTGEVKIECDLCGGTGTVPTRCPKCNLRIRGANHLEGDHHRGGAYDVKTAVTKAQKMV